jgi:hypothetical protein
MLLQQSVVIVRWAPNRGGAHWRAHGRYLAREGAQPEGQPGQGFNSSEEEIDIAERLGGWERAGEPRLWKLIISPEAGERLDLREHGRELVTTMEGDLGIRFRSSLAKQRTRRELGPCLSLRAWTEASSSFPKRRKSRSTGIGTRCCAGRL